jgi:FixJ family two-component response regulator
LSVNASGTVCIVEDNDDVRDSLHLLLEAEGYAVAQYASAEAFLAAADAGRYDCLLFDHNLGGMTGLQLLEQLHMRGVRTPAILLTGVSNLPSIRLATVLVVLKKPQPAAILLEWVGKACGGAAC